MFNFIKKSKSSNEIYEIRTHKLRLKVVYFTLKLRSLFLILYNFFYKSNLNYIN